MKLQEESRQFSSSNIFLELKILMMTFSLIRLIIYNNERISRKKKDNFLVLFNKEDIFLRKDIIYQNILIVFDFYWIFILIEI